MAMYKSKAVEAELIDNLQAKIQQLKEIDAEKSNNIELIKVYDEFTDALTTLTQRQKELALQALNQKQFFLTGCETNLPEVEIEPRVYDLIIEAFELETKYFKIIFK